MKLGNVIFRLVNRVFPLDASNVFLLPSGATAKHALEDTDLSCRILRKEDLLESSVQDVFSITPKFHADAEKYNFHVVGAFVGDEVAGLCCLTLQDVPAHLNTGGTPFKGIGMSLPANTAYLFKVFVRDEYRGKRLLGEMLNFALQSDDIAAGRAMVTTTAIVNTSFRKAIERIGFVRVGNAAEAIVFGRHFYKLPAPIDARPVATERSAAKPIVMKKPSEEEPVT